ncbi:MAG TPA: GntR family transcriptional regulator [Baekduia sp.]|nr:GntR family transcriptional regulator [Baekduia sp.]
MALDSSEAPAVTTPTDKTNPPIQGEPARSLADRAYRRLLQMIVRCELEPGAWVTVARLSDDIGIGRGPIYEALVRLESDGFVEPTKRRGWQVTPLTLRQVSYIVEAYRLAASQISALVIRNATDEQLQRQRELTESWGSDADAADVRQTFENAPFEHLTQICGNPFVAAMAGGISAHYARVMNLALLHGNFNDEAYHTLRSAVLDALQMRDVEAVQRSLDQLISAGEQEVHRVLRQTAPLLSASLTVNQRPAK